MAINDWLDAMSVPESVVFESANAIKRVLKQFLASSWRVLFVYFLWMMGYVRRMTAEKQRRLDTINHIYDVERLLFNAHEKKENVYAALEKLGSILSAGMVSFWILDADGGNEWFFWEKAGRQRNAEKTAAWNPPGSCWSFFLTAMKCTGRTASGSFATFSRKRSFQTFIMSPRCPWRT